MLKQILIKQYLTFLIECKYLKYRMGSSVAVSEEKKIRMIDGLDVKVIGFASANGFDFDSADFLLISGEDLYKIPRVNN